MNYINNILRESILDVDLDDIQNKAKTETKIPTEAEWLMSHGIKYDLSSAVNRITKSLQRGDKASASVWKDGGWVFLETDRITLGKNDKWPTGMKITAIGEIDFIGYDGTDLPGELKDVDVPIAVIIRNCPKLKSLHNCPQSSMQKFAVSGCPNIKKLDGCPKSVNKLFKFINNGISCGYKDIMKCCKVSKQNIIYDHD